MSEQALPVTVRPAIVRCQMCRELRQGAAFTVGREQQLRELCIYCLVAIAVDAFALIKNAERFQRRR